MLPQTHGEADQGVDPSGFPSQPVPHFTAAQTRGMSNLLGAEAGGVAAALASTATRALSKELCLQVFSHFILSPPHTDSCCSHCEVFLPLP